LREIEPPGGTAFPFHPPRGILRRAPASRAFYNGGRALRQREQVRSTPSVHIGPLSICRVERKAAWRGQRLPLTVREFDILTILAENYGRAVPRDLLLDLLLGVGYAGEAWVIDRHVMKLRRKLGDGACQIETVWGIGYRLSCRMGESGVSGSSSM